MTNTHDTTCGSEIGVSGVARWADFTKWVKERAAESRKDLRRREISIFEGEVSSERPGRAGVQEGPAPSSVGELRHVPGAPPSGGVALPPSLAREVATPARPLVNRCISQQGKKRSVLGVQFEVYPKSVRVVRPVQLPPGATRGGLRSEVDSFSPGSRRRLKRVASEAGDQLKSQFGLTYHNTRPTGEQVKQHLNAWLTWLRRRVPGIKYLWVLEFQRRGVPHFHVFMSQECVQDGTLQLHMAQKWNKITGESREHLFFHLHAKNFIPWDMGSGAYACKYLDKEYQKHVPDGFGWVGRFWGSSRSLMPKPVVYDIHDIRAMCGQNVYEPRMMVSRETHGRDAGAVVMRTLGNYQSSQWRRYGRKGAHLSTSKNSRWVQGGASVLWRIVEYLNVQADCVKVPPSGAFLEGGTFAHEASP